MKLALRYIPTEVWVDVIIFPWITRKKLGKIVHMFRNRYFAEILQYCLHDRGKRTLETVYLIKDAPIPQTPIPENIKFFELITIYDFDAQTLGFLRRISTLFATNDVTLIFDSGRQDDQTNLRTAFDNLAPLLHGIYSFAINQSDIPLVQQYFGQKLPQVKMISLDFDLERIDPATLQMDINFCIDWLTSAEQNPTEPKFLGVFICSAIMQQFTQPLQEQFLLAKKPCTFVFEFLFYDMDDPIANFHLENNIGEQLHGKSLGGGFFRICRCPVDFAKAKLEDWIEETFEKQYSSAINIDAFLTNGPIEANAGDNDVDEAGEEADQPSTSGHAF